MAVKKIKVGKTYTYSYRSRTGEYNGTGKVISTETKGTGEWVRLHDTERKRYVTIRPSQLS